MSMHDIYAEHTRRLNHIHRLFNVLCSVNRSITRKPGRQELLQEICRILVEVGSFRMVRFGVPDAGGWLVHEASFGDTQGYFNTIRTSVKDIPEGRGPTGTALRERRPVVNNNILTDPAMLPWREQALSNDFKSSACFPILLPSGDTGGLTLYSTECDFFSTDEEQLLVEIGADISYALEFVAAQELLLKQQRQLETMNEELEARVTQEVKISREKDRALLHMEKMASLGQLASGLAHEINNPIAFINGNLGSLTNYFDQMIRYDQLVQESLLQDFPPAKRAGLNERRQSLDVEYIFVDGVNLLLETIDGVNRIAKIVQDLKSFCRGDVQVKEPIDVNSCLERTLNIVASELKYVATVRKEYGNVPEVYGNLGQLNQVFLNLLVNASHAITPPGTLVLSSWHDDAFVYASVSDTGQGIPDEIQIGRAHV